MLERNCRCTHTIIIIHMHAYIRSMDTHEYTYNMQSVCVGGSCVGGYDI